MATLSVTTTSQDNARILTAFGRHLGFSNDGGVTFRDATAAEVKAAVIAWIVKTVRSAERDAAAEPSAVTPT